MRTYAIGDIHGQIDMLRRAHAQIDADRKRVDDSDAPIVHLGDLVDRGPDSKGVVQYLMDGISAGENWVVLKGNHDRMFLWFLEEASRADPHLFIGLDWLHYRLGGSETLGSYGVNVNDKRRYGEVHAEARTKVPQEHLDFIGERPTSFSRGELLFVHAGIRPNVSITDQHEDDLVWIREGFLDSNVDHGPLVVHGHTALNYATRYPNRVNLDSSAAYGKSLTAAVFEGRTAMKLTDTGRTEIPVSAVPATLPEKHAFKR
ncbi:metallophosphoesterase [Falsihalocynthiibacter sp. SS001]|uniref:metallophosphoesterase n=1 Tax=Falsihalocynthiibacter sp. SS001 TaxID=3349698 RepID=UPI0036D39356